MRAGHAERMGFRGHFLGEDGSRSRRPASATATAMSLADLVTIALIASSTRIDDPARRPSLEGACGRGVGGNRNFVARGGAALFQLFEQQIERHHLGDRGGMAQARFRSRRKARGRSPRPPRSRRWSRPRPFRDGRARDGRRNGRGGRRGRDGRDGGDGDGGPGPGSRSRATGEGEREGRNKRPGREADTKATLEHTMIRWPFPGRETRRRDVNLTKL